MVSVVPGTSARTDRRRDESICTRPMEAPAVLRNLTNAYWVVPLIEAIRTSTDVQACVAVAVSATWPVPDWLTTATRALGGASVGDPSALSTARRVTPVKPVSPALKSIDTRSLGGGGPVAMVTGSDVELSGPVFVPSEASTCQVWTDPCSRPVSAKPTVRGRRRDLPDGGGSSVAEDASRSACSLDRRWRGPR